MQKSKLTTRQLDAFACVRDTLHIYGYDVPRADFQIYEGETPTFRIDDTIYPTYRAFMLAANRINTLINLGLHK